MWWMCVLAEALVEQHDTTDADTMLTRACCVRRCRYQTIKALACLPQVAARRAARDDEVAGMP